MDLLREALAVGLVLGLLGALAWISRRGGAERGRALSELLRAASRPFRRGAGTPGNDGERVLARLEILSRAALTPQHVLHWVRAGSRDLLVVTHPQGCALLGEDAAEAGRRTEDREGCRGASPAGITNRAGA